jgi:hypothetical protein
LAGREASSGQKRAQRNPAASLPFADELNRDVVREILTWQGDRELGRILSALRSHDSRKAFFDTYAEALVARHVRSRGCTLRFEVPTPAGRRCDFEVAHADRIFYLHVKRLDTDVSSSRRITVPARLRSLERIARPYVVQVRWHDHLAQEHMQQLVVQAAKFIEAARIGDEMVARDHDGREIGGVRVIAPSLDEHVTVTIGLPTGFLDQAHRFRRLMHRAHAQFMPKAENVILICSGHRGDADDLETALLGSHIERWDAFPPRGKRIAHGRDTDGFWSGQRVPESHFAGWFKLGGAEGTLDSRLWMRDEQDAANPLYRLIADLFAPRSR